MSDLSPTQLVSRIVTEFCIPSIRGSGIGQEVGKPIELNQQQRLDAGLNQPGLTYAYTAKGAAVFLDLNDLRAQVWFIHPEAQTAKEPVASAMMAALPGLKQTGDLATADPKRRERVFVGELGDSKAVQIDISYPNGAGSTNMFIVRVQGMRIVDRAKFEKSVRDGPSQPSQPSRGTEPAPKKKGWF
jgi:hypothetical protein